MAGGLAGQVDRGRDALEGLVEGEVELSLQVVAPLRAGRPRGAPPAAEQAPEEITQVAQVPDPEVEPARTSATRTGEGVGAGTEGADLVVLLALGRVPEHVVGGRDVLEAILGSGVGVGVVLLGQLPVGARDLLLGGRVRHSENLVVVLLEPLALRGHGDRPGPA